MAQKIQAVYGNDVIQVSAKKGEFTLRISDCELKATALILTATNRRDMIDIISQIQDELTQIRWELDGYKGFLDGFDPDPEPEEAKEEGAEE